MYDDDYYDEPASALAQGFGFNSQREFDDYCDAMEAKAEDGEA